LIGRVRTDLPPEVYPPDPWVLSEDAFAPRFSYLTETIFALANGRIGLRATLDEGVGAHAHGTFINGFHETWDIVHPETAYGLATTGQTIVNVPDPSVTEIRVDGEELLPGNASEFKRWLDFREGILERSTVWQTGSGATVAVRHRRLVSLTTPELVAFRVEVEVDRPCSVEVTSHIVNRQDQVRGSDSGDPRQSSGLPHRVFEPRAATVGDGRVVQSWVTARSRRGLVVGIDHAFGIDPVESSQGRDADHFTFQFTFDATPDARIEMTRFAVYSAADGETTGEDRFAVEERLDEALTDGFDALAAAQEAHLADFWAEADIGVGAGTEFQRAIRWTLFQLHQGAANVNGASIPAKGLTGQAYDGHYFWDTEIYILPFLVYTQPEVAAKILRFRHSLLDASRRRAGQLSLRGALFPWRTITGEEASAYFPAGTAQYHINADIVYALRKYVEVSGDDDLLWDVGVEMAIETARMWHDLGFFRGNRFHIHGVTGPDEYTALVDDNAFTNAMARMNMRYAARCVDRMRLEAPDRFEGLADLLGIRDEEPAEWRLAADAMFIPFDAELGITPQDAHFLSAEPWDFATVPPSKYPLLLHFHPLVIYRYQVLKQADVVLADFLLGNEFPKGLKKANFDYYDPITTGDSSLSASVQAIMAAEIGYAEKAEDHFSHALFMDLADLAGNTTDGVHMASAGGVWMALVYGFAGLRDHDGALSFTPHVPQHWGDLSFRLRVGGRRLVVKVSATRIEFTLKGDPLEVWVRSEGVKLTQESTVSIALD